MTKKRSLLVLLLIAFIFVPSLAYAQASADYGGYRPQYQGYGTNTSGGRGGEIRKVTNLNDAGAGSFREAVAARTGCDNTPAKCARIVIFETSGTIALSSRIVIDSPYITIAGQTAPSPGITFRDSYFIIDTNNIVIQHIRVRPGPAGGQIPHGIWVRNDANNIVIDHVSISWTVWSSIDLFSSWNGPGVGDVTIIDSIVAEALSCSGRLPDGKGTGGYVNPQVPCDPTTGGPHSRAYLFGGDANNNPTYNNGRVRVAMIRSLSANNDERHPAIQGDTDAFVVNNLIYNPSKEPVSGIHFGPGYGAGGSTAVIVGNYMKPGPTTPGNLLGYIPPYYATEGDLYFLKTDFGIESGTRIYMLGNYYAKHCSNFSCLASSQAQWMMAKDKKSWQGIDVRTYTPPLTLANLPLSSVMPYTQVEAFVTANAGARPLDRDAVDIRTIASVLNGTGTYVNYPSEVGGWPVLAVNIRPLTIPANPNAIAPGQTFRTNIEMWLEDYARALEPANVVPIISPTISTFTSSQTLITQEESSTLNWSTNGATSVSIDNGIGLVSASGSKTISPSITTTYTLTATNSAGSATKSVTITVTPTTADYGGYRPHYQGYGTTTPGGRGGTVLRVTTIDGSGPGSFRAAIDAHNTLPCQPHFIVFEVSGTIRQTGLGFPTITCPKLTIAGQTSPSPGITLADHGLIIAASDVVIQHIRHRLGDVTYSGNGPIWSITIKSGAKDVVFDHISMSWGTSGHINANTYVQNEQGPQVTNLAFLDSLFAEPIEPASFGKGQKNILLYANFPAGQQSSATLLRNVFAHAQHRSPWISAGWRVNEVNSVAYNALGNAAAPGWMGYVQLVGVAYPTNNPINYVNIYSRYIQGPNGHFDEKPIKIALKSAQISSGSSVYLEGIAFPGITTPPSSTPWKDYVVYCDGPPSECSDQELGTNAATEANTKITSPPNWHINMKITPIPTADVLTAVVANAGARPLDRDAVDKRIAAQVLAGSGGTLIKSQSQVGGWPALAVNKRIYVTPANPNNPGTCGSAGGSARTVIECDLEMKARELEVPYQSNSIPPTPTTTSSQSNLGLVAHYKFDESSGITASDSSGNNNVGTLTNGASFAAGKVGNAISLDGADDYVNVLDSSSLDLISAFTFSAWVKPDTTSSNFRSIFVKNYVYYLYANSLSCGAGSTLAGINSNAGNVCHATQLPVNTWTLVTATYDGASLSLYKNGVKVDSVQKTGSVPISTGALQIGASQFGEYFDGLIDDVRIYNMALPSSEIIELYDADTPSTNNLGDLNNDNKVDLLDVMLILKDFGKTSGFDVKNDVKKDGVINILDVVEIIKGWK